MCARALHGGGISRCSLTSVTENNSLESESLLQFVDNGTSLEFLDETNSSVEQKKTADDTEIDPILETSGPGLELAKTFDAERVDTGLNYRTAAA